MRELGSAGKDSGTGGRQPTGLRYVFQGSSAGGNFIWVGDVGDEPLHGTGPGKLPAQGRQEDNGEASKDTGGWGLEVPTAGDRNGRGGF